MNKKRVYLWVIPMLLAWALHGAAVATEPARGDVVRLAVVNTLQSSGLLAALLPGFEQQTGLSVEVYNGNDVYARARAGEADVVIAHYGKQGVERFVLDGYGTWPRMVFSNQAVLIGHKSDPAGVRGLGSITEALARIEAAGATFVHNDIRTIRYLTEIALASIGQPARSGWFVESDQSKAASVLLAEEKKGYVIWGAFPFLRFNNPRGDSEVEILVADDPALQRIMSATVVRPEKVPGVNAKGAGLLVEYLLSPPVQARIAAFRTPGSDLQLWWPAGHDN